MTEHIVANFNTQEAADEAARELENAGFPASAAIRQRTRRQIAAEAGRTSLWSQPQRQLPQAVVDFGRGCLAKRVLRPEQSIPAMRNGNNPARRCWRYGSERGSNRRQQNSPGYDHPLLRSHHPIENGGDHRGE